MADPNDPVVAQPPASSLVDVTLSNGTVVRVHPEDVGKIQAQGGGIATPEQVQYAREREEYGGLGSQLAAGAAGLLRGGTAGLSDVVLGGLGMSKTLSKLREYNPLTSTGADIAGGVAGSFIGGPMSSIGRVGEAAEHFVAEGLGRGLVSSAARGLVEGAATGVGSALSEAALGNDYSKLGELLSSQVGLGALTGGGAGLTLSLAAKGATALTSGIRSGLSDTLSKPSAASIQRIVEGSLGDAAPELGTAVASATKAPWYAKLGARLSSTLNPQNDRAVIEEFLASPEARAHAVHYEDLLDKASTDLTDRLRELHKTVERSGEAFMGPMKQSEIVTALGDANKAAAGDTLLQSLGDYQSFLARPELAEFKQYPDLVKKFEAAAVRVTKGINTGTDEGLADAFMTVDELKRSLGKRARKLSKIGGDGLHGLDPTQRATREGLIDAYNRMRAALEDDAWGTAGRKQAAVNEPWSSLFKDEEKAGGASFGSSFLKSTPTGDFGATHSVVDPEKVRTWLHGLTNRNASERLAGLNAYLDRAKQFVTASREHLALTPAQRAAADRVEQQVSSVTKQVNEATAVAAHKNQFDALTNSSNSGAFKAMLGHMIGGVPGAIGGMAAGVAADPRRMIRMLAAIDNVTSAGTKRVSSALDSAASRATTLPNRTLTLSGRIGSVAAKTALEVQSYNRLRKNDIEYEKRAQTIAHIASQPQNTALLSSAAFHDIAAAAPNVTAAASAALERSIAYLQQELPKLGLSNPFTAKQPPTSSEKTEFNKKARAVDQPADLLERALGGKATYWESAAVASTAPALYASMQRDAFEMLSNLAADGRQLNYQDRTRLDLALGLHVEPMLEPAMMADIQASFAVPPTPPTPPSDAEAHKQSAASQTRPEAISRPEG